MAAMRSGWDICDPWIQSEGGDGGPGAAQREKEMGLVRRGAPRRLRMTLTVAPMTRRSMIRRGTSGAMADRMSSRPPQAEEVTRRTRISEEEGDCGVKVGPRLPMGFVGMKSLLIAQGAVAFRDGWNTKGYTGLEGNRMTEGPTGPFNPAETRGLVIKTYVLLLPGVNMVMKMMSYCTLPLPSAALPVFPVLMVEMRMVAEQLPTLTIARAGAKCALELTQANRLSALTSALCATGRACTPMEHLASDVKRAAATAKAGLRMRTRGGRPALGHSFLPPSAMPTCERVKLMEAMQPKDARRTW